ncbi:MAG TPA: class I SAM-dependent methyltransferase [Kiloniellaceae bacterium]|nr:class I SAM-dependent methyltransferase [Kiloniellaceae bacterium]
MTKHSSAAQRWDARYADADAPLFGAAPNEYLRMVTARSDFDARSALCLADGDGRNGAWLARQGLTVTALDISAVATERALAFDRDNAVAVERLTADLDVWTAPEGRRWDLVTLLYLQAPGSTRARALELAAAALAPGGWLVVEAFAKAQAAQPNMGPDNPDLLYDIAELRAATPGLTVVEALEGEVHLEEGSRHRGPAQVVRFAARRPGL